MPTEEKPEERKTVTIGTQEWEGPQTVDEARCFHEGFISGLTVYAREKGALKRLRQSLRAARMAEGT